ncbi:hypothetical protein CDCA_CDCA01G0193 [Cyanidium caldarium]|uniref:GPN-loop GTPase n=1 Tax=Cyanidium caldarium TaxID=2771 RepID=A0AAV9IQC2_CYACA|nr:hypothetical protein CDCA_CDCA01G0193 [Cyanidium caldarium]
MTEAAAARDSTSAESPTSPDDPPSSSSPRPLFLQLVVGPPGSGKTTYCAAMSQLCAVLGRRHLVVNLDPAVDHQESPPYTADVDVRDLVAAETVMQRWALGPNGALTYCLEYLLENVDWLQTRLQTLREGDSGDPVDYVIVDMPGQVELYSHHHAASELVRRLCRSTDAAPALDVRGVCVNLIDSQCCADAGKYLASSLVALMTMLRMELPHVNVLSKVDLFEAEYARQMAALDHDDDEEGRTAPGALFALDFYTEAMDLDTLLPHLDAKYARLNRAVVALLNDYGLVRFHPASVADIASLQAVLEAADRACGYCFAERDWRRQAADAEAAPASDK